MNDRELQLSVLQLAVIADCRPNFDNTNLCEAFDKISLRNFNEAYYIYLILFIFIFRQQEIF